MRRVPGSAHLAAQRHPGIALGADLGLTAAAGPGWTYFGTRPSADCQEQIKPIF